MVGARVEVPASHVHVWGTSTTTRVLPKEGNDHDTNQLAVTGPLMGNGDVRSYTDLGKI